MRVAVLGGGLQGCCIAIALADRGVQVTLFDRNADLLTRAAVANEGKIHLGYMYAGDPTLKTARMMMQGALSFAPFLSRYLGVSIASFRVSDPAVYVVHRDSQRSSDDVRAYILAVHALVQEAAAKRNGAYFGMDLAAPIRVWSRAELERELDPNEAMAAFESCEVAIDPIALARLIRNRIAQTPNIELRLQHAITAVEDGDELEVASVHDGIAQRERFDHVVNCLWDGRLAVDGSIGFRPGRPWIHRLKYGVTFRPPPTARIARSITVVLGPFGEVVRYAGGAIYLTWYPDCLLGRSHEVQPPDWSMSPQEPLRSAILQSTFNALATILPALQTCKVDELLDVNVRGGIIVAWGETDIDDPASELHRRFEIGVTSRGRYHSVDPGKLTMAPHFAAECAARVVGQDSERPI
jgi:glycine/D-amino acid oxidase-like deaminating enzyme